MADDWKVIQAKKSSFNLNKLFNPEFMSVLEENFGDKNINLVNIGIAFMDKDVDPTEDNLDSKMGIVEINNRSIEDTINEIITLSTNNPDYFLKLKEILDEF